LKKNPTYSSIGDHSETMQLEFDPKVTTYENLLRMFWSGHDPTRKSWSRQYLCAIFYHNEEQHSLALKTAKQMEARLGHKIETMIEPATEFYSAEFYHQKYLLQKEELLMKAFKKMSDKEFIRSSAASRMNGYVGGYGTPEDLEKEISAFGLNKDQESALREVVLRKSGKRKVKCVA